ncbi:helix-turn-helix transcriptional regulator [Duganella sp. Leaf61]|uniref:helix-turn-helix transcriptional regulator n=1 Tax=Duganella sp. Leaf61 TaxID=1736227 RepID=UPI0009EB89BA|nr:helix-turn-helix transcriptional regulator [Duganella sp. Leaf61]
MIKNQRQYNLTKNSAAMFAEALVRLRTEECPQGVDPLMFKAQHDGLESQLETLLAEVKEYEALRNGEIESLSLVGLEELPLGLIKARIARGLTQKQLAALIDVKPQQVQRWEHEDYENVGFLKLVEIAKALELSISEHIELPAKPRSAIMDLKRHGIDKTFLLARLASNDAQYRLDSFTDADLLSAAAGRLHKIFGMRVAANGVFFSDDRFKLACAGARFKVPQNADKAKVTAYAVYAHHLADIVAKATRHLPLHAVPDSWTELRKALCGESKPNFESILRGAWAMGIPVLPLADPIHFHGVCWRFDYRNVIVLKQSTQYSSRWAFDLLHEIHHAGENPELHALEPLDGDATDNERRDSDEEHEANNLAGDVLFSGRAQKLYDLVLAQSGGQIVRIKNSVISVSAAENVSTADLANYVAYRLQKEKFITWWGAANNLQPSDENPLKVARKVFMENFDFGSLDKDDCELLKQALLDPAF